MVKRLWGFAKVRYRGLAKNLARAFSLFALANLYLVRRQLLPPAGEVRPVKYRDPSDPGPAGLAERDDEVDLRLDRRRFMNQPTISLCTATCAELP